MKRFIKLVTLTIGMLFVLNVVLDYCFTVFLNQSQSELYKEWNRIIHGTIDADLVVIGSSRAWAQYDPHIMDSILLANSYNLGINGGSVNRQIVKYKVFRHYQKKKPSFLIVNFDYWNTWVINRFQREQYFPYLANVYMRKLIIDQEPFSLMELYLPMYRYYFQGVSKLLREAMEIENTYKGYHAHDLEWDGEEFAKVKTVMFESLQNVVDEFDVFLSDLQRDDVKVIFVCSPIYIGVTEMTVNLSEFYDFRKHFSEKYGIPVLDYINDPICTDTTCFYNATHLNKKGAELFTTKLCQDLDSLGILKQR